MENSTLLYTLALLKARGIGDILAKQVILEFGSARDFFKTDLSKFQNVDQRLVLSDSEKSNALKQAEQEISFIEQNQIEYYFIEDSNYPHYLKQCPDAPIILFYKGHIDLSSERILSIVGTRSATKQGIENCVKIVDELSAYNPIIVSGFAYGIDIAAHKAAINNNLQTIGVLAHGLDQIYPADHKKYVPDVVKNGGFITDFFSGINPERHNFLKRNRIIAGISSATLVVESLSKGGSLITAHLANSYSRDVFALPGRINDSANSGCNNLIKRHKAQLIICAKDIAEQLNWEKPIYTVDPLPKKGNLQLTDLEKKIYDYLIKNEKASIDELISVFDIPTSEITTLILKMELRGFVRSLGASVYTFN